VLWRSRVNLASLGVSWMDSSMTWCRRLPASSRQETRVGRLSPGEDVLVVEQGPVLRPRSLNSSSIVVTSLDHVEQANVGDAGALDLS
jgi:hypothetical protein